MMLVLTLLFIQILFIECPEAIFIMCFQSIYGVMIQAFMVIKLIFDCDGVSSSKSLTL